MKRVVTAAALFLVIFGVAASAAAAESRVALVIGNSAYEDSPLANPANDARLMAETLRGLGFDVIERTDADQKQMKIAIFELGDRLEAAGRDAVGLFYYAGHGVQVDGENFLIPLGAAISKERHVAIEAVGASWVLGQMEFAGNRVNFVILDACRNNPLTRGFRSQVRGLAKMNAPTGSLVAYSTGPGDVAADGENANSPYTLALSQVMQLPGLPAEKVFKLVRDAVREATNDEQTPWEESSMTGADFYFNIDVSVTVEAPEASATSDTAAATQQESLFWESIKDSTDPASFVVYIAEYPNGKFAALARLRMSQIKEAQTAAVVPPPTPSTGTVEPAVGVYPKTYQSGDTFMDCDTCPEDGGDPEGGFHDGLAFLRGRPLGQRGSRPSCSASIVRARQIRSNARPVRRLRARHGLQRGRRLLCRQGRRRVWQTGVEELARPELRADRPGPGCVHQLGRRQRVYRVVGMADRKTISATVGVGMGIRRARRDDHGTALG